MQADWPAIGSLASPAAWPGAEVIAVGPSQPWMHWSRTGQEPPWAWRPPRLSAGMGHEQGPWPGREFRPSAASKRFGHGIRRVPGRGAVLGLLAGFVQSPAPLIGRSGAPKLATDDGVGLPRPIAWNDLGSSPSARAARLAPTSRGWRHRDAVLAPAEMPGPNAGGRCPGARGSARRFGRRCDRSEVIV